MDPSGTAVLPWAASTMHMDPRARPIPVTFNMNERPMSQPTGQPRPPTTIVQVCADVKPRLTKEQHEILERHFQAQPKPSTSVKKGFADALGVPLDKINNWFQNRRAKVKQDAKKQMNALQLFQATIAQHSQQYLGHPPQVPAALPYHYGPLPVVPSNNEPVHDPSVAPSQANPMHTNVPVSRDGAFAPPPEYAMHAPAMTSAPQNMSFEAQNFQCLTEPPMLLQDFNFGSFSQEFNGMPENFDMLVQQPGITPVSMDSMPAGPVLTPPADSPNTMPSLTSAYTHPSQCDDEKPQFLVDSPHEFTDLSATNGHPTPADSTSAWSSTAPGSEVFNQQGMHAPQLALSQDSPASVDSFDNRESSTLSESVLSVNIDHSSDSESSFKAPSQASSIAARRQKPRPANLMSSALRSASYSAGMPGSPGANANPGAQDQLRRIRSHGITNGRISKVPGPQKSPLHPNFDAAAITSPKFARHASNYSVSTINSSGPLTATTMPGSLAPPTPITPNEFTRFPMSQAPGMFFPNGSPGAFSHAGEDPIYLDTSSPMSKLDMQQMEQFRANMMARHEASLFNTPPQSAPAIQQHFGFTPPGMRPRQLLNAPPHSGLGHVRRPSLPDANHGPEPAVQFPSQLLAQAGQGMQPPFQPQLAEAFNAESQGFSLPQGMPMHGDCVGDMSLQFMVPHPVKITSDPRLPVHFHNQTPEDFQKQPQHA